MCVKKTALRGSATGLGLTLAYLRKGLGIASDPTRSDGCVEREKRMGAQMNVAPNV